MKHRQGFVSNSSSTSFCIYGVSLSDKEVSDVYAKLFPPTLQKYDKVGAVAEKLELTWHRENQDSDYYVVGREYSSIADDETGAQFKEDVRKKLSAVIPDPKPGHHENGWYDG